MKERGELDEESTESYSHFIEHQFPFKALTNDMSPAEAAAGKALNRATRQNRQTKKIQFTHSGQPGAALAGEVSELLSHLELPPAVRESCQKISFLKSGYYHMLPAYFVTVEHLVSSLEPFGIVFRTFGGDLPAILEEHNMYCEGRHPAFPEAGLLDGSVAGRPDLRLKCRHTGRILRHAGLHGSDLMALAITHSSPDLPAIIDIVEGPAAVSAAIDSRLGVQTDQASSATAATTGLQPHPMLALRDDYQFWHTHGEVAEGGKLLLVDPSNPHVHPVFFDDNIGEHEAGIVDVRHSHTGEPIPFRLTKNVFLVRANAAEAVRDPQYFVKQLKLCAANRAKQLQTGPAATTEQPVSD
jgi:hypothetical protein